MLGFTEISSPLAWHADDVSKDFVFPGAGVLPPRRYFLALLRLDDLKGGRWLGRAPYDVLKQIIVRGMDGCDRDSIAKIAVDAGVCRRTVQKAVDAGEELGIIRRHPCFDSTDVRGSQGTNRWEVLKPPTEPVVPKPKPAKNPGPPRGCKPDTPSGESINPSPLLVPKPVDMWKTRGRNIAGEALVAARKRAEAVLRAGSATNPRIEVDWGSFHGPRRRLF